MKLGKRQLTLLYRGTTKNFIYVQDAKEIFETNYGVALGKIELLEMMGYLERENIDFPPMVRWILTKFGRITVEKTRVR